MPLTATSFLFVLVTHFEGSRGGSLTLRPLPGRNGQNWTETHAPSLH